MIPLVDLKAQYRIIRPEIDAALERVLVNTSFILGQEVSSFEESFAAFCNVEYAVGASSGTSAIHLALVACGIGPGDEVITTPHTFIATVEPIIHTGAVPVLVDIDINSYNLDPDRIESALTERTKAILPVHLYGHPADMDPILEVADKYDLKVIEDAAQAHGAEYKGKKMGSMGDAACFSFYPGKNLGAYGDGGMIVTRNEKIAERARMLRNHGRKAKYEHEIVGYGYRLDALQAAILKVKLDRLDEWNQQRRECAETYRVLLNGLDLVLPTEQPHIQPVYHLFVIRTQKRDQLLQYLRSKEIHAGIHYPIPLHLQPSLAYLGYNKGDFPDAEKAAKEVLSLPMYPELTQSQLEQIAQAVRVFLS